MGLGTKLHSTGMIFQEGVLKHRRFDKYLAFI